jgi:hypothetical protein
MKAPADSQVVSKDAAEFKTVNGANATATSSPGLIG